MTATDEPCDVPHLPYFWTHDDVLHIELLKLPKSISVRLPDQRDREVGSARVWQYTLGTGTCHIVKASRKYVLSDGTELFEDGCSVCNCYIGEDDNYCSNCGAKVVDTEACQADTDRLDSGHVHNLSAYEAGYRDGSMHYELDHCPACKNIADLQEALTENTKLHKENDTLCRRIDELCMEVEKLRELAKDLYAMAYWEAPSAFEETFGDRMSELGIEDGS